MDPARTAGLKTVLKAAFVVAGLFVLSMFLVWPQHIKIVEQQKAYEAREFVEKVRAAEKIRTRLGGRAGSLAELGVSTATLQYFDMESFEPGKTPSGWKMLLRRKEDVTYYRRYGIAYDADSDVLTCVGGEKEHCSEDLLPQ